jgi:heptosyltransferase III
VNILFISWTRIGDAVLSTGVLHELTRRHPDAKITVVCGPLAASLFANVPGLERVIALRKRGLNLHWFSLWRQVVGQRWDLVLDLRRSLTAYVLRAKQRRILGRTDNTQHRVAWLPTIIGLSAPLNPHLWISLAQRALAEKILPDGARTLAIAPIAARPDKTWSAENFASLVGMLRAEGGLCQGWRVLMLAGPGEEAQFKPLIDAVPASALVLVTGQPDLLVVAAALARSDLYIGNDSGLTHMAAAVGVPTLALFGPTNPQHYGPWGEYACVVEAPLVEGRRDMAGLRVEAVAEAARQMQGRHQG